METLEIQSKDFLVKWIYAQDNCSIVWEAKPLKKTINFGIYKKNEFNNSADSLGTYATDSGNTQEQNAIPNFVDPFETLDPTRMDRKRSPSVTTVNKITELSVFKSKSRSASFTNSLTNSNLSLLKNYQRLIPGELVKGTFEVSKGGMFAFIFDNSFSKTTSKKVLFSSTIVNGLESSMLTSLGKNVVIDDTPAKSPKPSNSVPRNIMKTKNGEVLQSLLLKKRRKRHQGYTKRQFVLNFKYGTLSYFKNNDKNLRGQMPITSSIVSANYKTREIFIDSGMEVWDLKALNKHDFEVWVDAFNVVKRSEPTSQEATDEHGSYKYKQLIESTQEKLSFLLTNDLPKDELKAQILSIYSHIENVTNAKLGANLSPITSYGDYFDAHDNIGEAVVIMDSFPNEKKWDVALEEHDTSESDSESEDEIPIPSASAQGEITNTADADSTLYPLPIEHVERESDIPVFDHDPPSLLSFVRKNVGKDMSSLSMPVDMNEPVTILQKYAELLEYCDLIENALKGNDEESSGEKILRIAAFATSYLSSMRNKVRSSRKPFNPLLGETFELVREDKGFRLLCEKVSHRPPVFALNVDSANWNLSFSPSPSQKFWGKTSEFFTSGMVRLRIKSSGEVFTWNHPTCVLKNIIAGEKYTEPCSLITVKSSSGQRAVVEFAKGGMFSGRSEDLFIKAYDQSKRQLAYSVNGTWTESMTLKTGTVEKTIWTAGPLLSNWEKKFGFTKYVGTLNKITKIEEGLLPPTDSRLRPDMLAYSKGDIATAEKLKRELEEGQRQRRQALEDLHESYKPAYFVQKGGNPSKPDTGEWVYKSGKDSYWNRRKDRRWPESATLW